MEIKTEGPSRLWALGLIIFCLLQACTESLDTSMDFDTACWEKGDTIYYSLENAPSSISVKPVVYFNNDYSYRNLYLKVILKEGNTVLKDVMLDNIFMDEMGVWSVPYQSGSYRVDFNTDLEIPEGATQIGLVQYMRDDELCGIESAGFNVE